MTHESARDEDLATGGRVYPFPVPPDHVGRSRDEPGREVEPHVVDAEIVDDEPVEAAPVEPLAGTVVVRPRPGAPILYRAQQALRRPDRIAVAVLRHELVYGSIGSARALGVVWAWVTARELDAQLATQPRLVLEARRTRQRVALAVTGAVTVAGAAAWMLLSPAVPILAVALVLAVAGAVERSRTAAQEDGARAALGPNPGGKAVRRAFGHARISRFEDTRVIGPITRVGAAWEALVELPPGVTYKHAVKRRGELAAAIGVDEVQVALDPVKGHAGRVRIWVADEDPMQGARVENPLLTERGGVNFWTDRLFAGRDARGRAVTFSMVERSYLIGGEPGGGKSVASNNVLAFFFLDPRVSVYLADGKFGTDLMVWEPMARRVLTDKAQDAMLEFVAEVREEMERRYALKRRLGVETFTEADAEKYGLHPVVVHVDEVQYWIASGDPKLDKACMTAIADLVGRGRAVGIITGIITQRPAAEVVPTRLRDILSIRWALRCTTPAASDTVLGQGWAGRGYSAAMIQPDQRGAGYVLAEGTRPVQLRSAFMNPALGEVRTVADRAYELREQAGTLPVGHDHPHRRVLAAVLRAMGEADRMHSDRLAAALGDGWSQERLAEALRPLGITPRQMKALAVDGVERNRNRNGYDRRTLQEALERL